MAHDTLPLKAQKRQPPTVGSWRNIAIGMIMGGEVEQLCRFVDILVYSNRQAFFDALPQ